jgi:hypothetical protein
MLPLAYVHNNIILQPDGFEVLGVILGQCVFGTKEELKGKFVHKTLYNTSGEKIGEEKSLRVSFNYLLCANAFMNQIYLIYH